MIRLFIIEDHVTIIVSGLKRLFYSSRDGIEVTGFAQSVDEAIEAGDINSFDLIMLDLWLENREPIENFRRLTDHFPSKPIIIYTSEVSFSWIQRMYNEGAKAYLTKSASRTEIKNAIVNVKKGEKVFPVSLDQMMQKEALQLKNKEKEEGQEPLTRVQKEILEMLSKGLIHKEIADALNISPSNVEKTLKSLRIQFNVRNNVELMWLLTKTGKSETND